MASLLFAVALSTSFLGLSAAMPNVAAPLAHDLHVPGADELSSVKMMCGAAKMDAEKPKLDLTGFQHLTSPAAEENAQKYADISYPPPSGLGHDVSYLSEFIQKDVMQSQLEALTSLHDRFYLSTTGQVATNLVYTMAADIIASHQPTVAKVTTFTHKDFPQDSVIVVIPGRTESKIILGAHLDSINFATENMTSPIHGPAPGADDGGSGTVTNLAALDALLHNSGIAAGNQINTIEFHWYAAEEVGLKGSLEIFDTYLGNNVTVGAMLQQDMTGFTSGKMGLLVDEFVNEPLTEFMRLLFADYYPIGYDETQCNYECSDHAAASKAGYPAAAVFESALEHADMHFVNVHGDVDTVANINFDHMRDHAMLAIAFIMGLGWVNF